MEVAMGLSYTFSLAAQTTPEVIIQQLLEGLGQAPGTQGLQKRIAADGSEAFDSIAAGIEVHSAYTPSQRRTFLKEKLGIDPRVDLECKVGTTDPDFDVSRKRLLAAIASMLQRSSDDALLLFDGEIVLLLRLQESLRINQDAQLASPDILRFFTLPYKMAQFSVL